MFLTSIIRMEHALFDIIPTICPICPPSALKLDDETFQWVSKKRLPDHWIPYSFRILQPGLIRLVVCRRYSSLR